MRVFISIDMEGISGLVNWREPRERMSKEMEADLLAAINGAMEAGAEEILVADSHSLGMNVSPDILPDNVTLVRGFPRKYYMMEGLTPDYDVVFFIGYHAPAGYIHGQMDHTYSSYSLFEVKVNGEIFGEAELNALYAGQLGVPVGLITGDRALFEFSHEKFPSSVRFVVTKEGISRFSARLFPVSRVREEIKASAYKVVKNVNSLEIFKRPLDMGKFMVELTLSDTLKADLIEVMPGFERIDGRRLIYRASSPAEVLRVVNAASIMGSYAKFLTS